MKSVEPAGSGRDYPQLDDRPFDDSEVEGDDVELNPPRPYLIVDAEESVLSAMLMEAAAVAEVRALGLRPEDFADRKRARVCVAMFALEQRGIPIDPLTLSAELNGSLEAIGGKDYIGYLVDVVPTAANVRHHAELVLDNAKRRVLADCLETNARALREGSAKPVDVAARLRPALDTLAVNGDATALLDDEELMHVEAPPPLVEGILPSDSHVQLFGASGSYKSFVALDLACHVATGLDWHGHSVKRGLVVYVCAEGGFGMKARVAAWKRSYNYSGKLGVYFFCSRVAITPKQSDVAALISRILTKLPSQPSLVILDTKARNYEGNENATEDESLFVVGCDLLRAAFGACIFVVHHTGWTEADRGRGSSAAYAALDTEIQCSKDAARVTLHCTKQKDSEAFQDLAFEAIAEHQSLVLKPMDQAGGKLDGRRLLCLQALHRLDVDASYSMWRKEAGLDAKNSSFAAARSWLVTQAYVRQGAKEKYSVTDAGRMALGPLSIGGPRPVHLSAESPVHRAGGLEDPALDGSDALEIELELVPPDPARAT
jgi:hypothetical protein